MTTELTKNTKRIPPSFHKGSSLGPATTRIVSNSLRHTEKARVRGPKVPLVDRSKIPEITQVFLEKPQLNGSTEERAQTT